MKRTKTGMLRLLLVIAIPALLVVGPLPGPAPASADQTFTVNSTADPGDGLCAGECTLREAITAANATDAPDTIVFAIPGEGVQTIRPLRLLPTIFRPVTIDGYTQPGAKANTAATGTNAVLMIELDGSAATSGADGLRVFGGDTTIRGLVINGFRDPNDAPVVDGHGIVLGDASGNSEHLIRGNFIGTDATGRVAKPNAGDGVLALGQNERSLIGGPLPEHRNLIAGNRGNGVRSLSQLVSIADNLIGTDATVTQRLGNRGAGIVLAASLNRITGNAIAFNRGAGVAVDDAAIHNLIAANSIFANGGIGIDLGNDGPTANDPGDADSGANLGLNSPRLTAATTSERGTTIRGTLDSNPGNSFKIQFFANPRARGAEGKTFLGQSEVRTDAGGQAGFTFKLPRAKPVPPGQAITAVTLLLDHTSEFSPPTVVKAAR